MEKSKENSWFRKCSRFSGLIIFFCFICLPSKILAYNIDTTGFARATPPYQSGIDFGFSLGIFEQEASIQ